MAAPPMTLVHAMRSGIWQRHLFFKLEHADGDVLAWDGVGSKVFSGDTYEGVAGLAQVSGVSQSNDLQNHEIEVTLNGIPLPDVSDINPTVRDVPVSLTAVWLDVDGVVQESRLLFEGTGANVVIEPSGDARRLRVRARGAFVDWRASPRTYYTDAEQQRLFPGDTGFSFVRSLENATVAGWSVNEESGGGIPTRYTESTGPYASVYFHDSANKRLIGDNTYGATVIATGSGVKTVSGVAYLEETTGATIGNDNNVPWQMKAGGVACYVDTLGDVRTPGGKLIYPTGQTLPGYRMRVSGEITADGTASGAFPQLPSGTGAIPLYSSAGPLSLTDVNQTARVFCNQYGAEIRVDSADPHPYDYREFLLGSGAKIYYVEAVTGATVTVLFTGTFRMQVGGVDCVVSTTGVILSPTGRRIVRSGGDPTKAFLRVWT